MEEKKDSKEYGKKLKFDFYSIVDLITLLTGVLYAELDKRLTFKDALLKALKKPVPQHINVMHCFGGITFLLFINQIVTGVLLAMYYKPTPAEAYPSVIFIMTKVKFGWLIRQLHAWGANLMISMLILHMLRVVIHGAYKSPREFTWVSGTFLLFVTITFGFTGYLLPWDQLSYWATTVGTEIAGSVPFIGKYLLIALRGGEDVSGSTLTRFYAVHTLILPWISTFLLMIHFLLIRRLGITEPL